jgi:hypothetical protein
MISIDSRLSAEKLRQDQQNCSKIRLGKAIRKIKMDNLYFWTLVSMK